MRDYADAGDAEMTARLEGYLRTRRPDAGAVTVTGLRRIVGGASRETWTFDATWSVSGGRQTEGLILRKDPPASNLVTDRALEYAFYSAFAGTEVPVPRMRWLEESLDLFTSPF